MRAARCLGFNTLAELAQLDVVEGLLQIEDLATDGRLGIPDPEFVDFLCRCSEMGLNNPTIMQRFDYGKRIHSVNGVYLGELADSAMSRISQMINACIQEPWHP